MPAIGTSFIVDNDRRDGNVSTMDLPEEAFILVRAVKTEAFVATWVNFDFVHQGKLRVSKKDIYDHISQPDLTIMLLVVERSTEIPVSFLRIE